MIKLFKHLRTKDWIVIAVSIVFIVLQVWLDLKLPDYMSEITALLQTEGSQMSDVLYAGGKMLLCALGSLAAAIIVGYFSARIAANFSQTLRDKLYHKIQSFSMEEINGFSTASLITRSTNDITQIQMIVAMGLQLIIKAPIMAVVAIIKIANKGTWQWSLLTAGIVIALMTAIICIMLYAVPKFKKIQGQTDNLNRLVRENLTGLRVVRAYNAEEYQEEKFSVANNELTETHLKAQRALTIMNPMMTLVMNGLTLGVYWIGAVIINAAAMADKLTLFSNMVVFSSYAMQVVMAFTMLTMIFIMLPRAQVSAKRINEVLDTQSNIHDGEKIEGMEGVEGEIEFKHVSFQYPDAEEYVLHDINFKANKGETIAFIGATGSGKSTVVNLIARFYDATEGEVLVDGVNVKEYTQEALHNKLGFVPQKSVLFHGTIASNVAFGDNGRGPVSEEDIVKSVRIAQGTEFVEELPDKYNGHVAQNGTNFSGGQKQRLSIARAICRKPEFYVFDDSFSALDYRTDRVLRSELKKETAGVTTIIVAQRIGTIMDADKIVVIDDGVVVGMGKHEELLKTCDVYQEIAYSQLSKEELEA